MQYLSGLLSLCRPLELDQEVICYAQLIIGRALGYYHRHFLPLVAHYDILLRGCTLFCHITSMRKCEAAFDPGGGISNASRTTIGNVFDLFIPCYPNNKPSLHSLNHSRPLQAFAFQNYLEPPQVTRTEPPRKQSDAIKKG